MDQRLEKLKEFYHKVSVWMEGSSLPRWAREDLNELLEEHKS